MAMLILETANQQTTTKTLRQDYGYRSVPAWLVLGVFVTLWVFSGFGFARPVVVDDQPRILLASKAAYWIDASGTASLDTVRLQDWIPVETDWVNRGLDDRVYWYRMDLKTVKNGQGHWLLRAGLPHQFVQAWLLRPGYEPLVLVPSRAGELFSMDLAIGEASLVLRSQATGWHMQWLELVRAEAYWRGRMTDSMVSGIYYGAVATFLLLALVLGIRLREAVYFYFAVTQLALAAYQWVAVDFQAAAWLDGPRSQGLVAYMMALFVALAFTAYARSSLDTAGKLPRLDWLLRGLLWTYVVSLLVLPFLSLPVMLWLVAPLGVLTPVSLLWTGVVAVKRGLPSARFFLAGWGVYQLGMVVYTLGVSNVGPFSMQPLSQGMLFKLVFLLEALLLALGLAERYHALRRSLVQRQRELLALREQQASRLEAMVEQRTVELEEINLELAHSDATKDRLMSVIAHDLRAGVASLRMSLEDLLPEPAPRSSLSGPYPQAEEKFSGHGLGHDSGHGGVSVERSVERMASMRGVAQGLEETLNGLLRWARAQRHDLSPVCAVVDVADLLEQLRRELAGQFEAEGVVLAVDSQALKCSTDTDMLGVILRNLLSNALHFTPSGGKVRVCAVAMGDAGIEIVVSDNGVGMPEQQRARLFEAAYSPLAGTDGRKGAGVGLLLVQEFATALGFSLRVESAVGQGTSVYLRMSSGSSLSRVTGALNQTDW